MRLVPGSCIARNCADTMKFILIALLWATDHALVVEFDTKQACEDARRAIAPMTTSLSNREGQYGASCCVRCEGRAMRERTRSADSPK